MTRRAALACALLTGALGCAGGAASYGPDRVDIPSSDGARPGKQAAPRPARQAPPSSGPTRESPFPPVTRFKLANGMKVAVITSRGLPLVHLRVHVEAGAGYGPTPAVARVTAGMLESGGTRAMSSAEVMRRIESLGAELSVTTGFDSTDLVLPLTNEHLPEGIALLAQVLREPRFDDDELRRQKARSLERASDAARSRGAEVALQLIFRELYPEKSVYSAYRPLPSHIARADGAAVREFHRRFYVPRATTLILAGDIDEPAARSLAERHFGAWSGGEPPKVEHLPPRPPARTRVMVVHRPRSVQSEIYVALLAPPRKAEEWPAVRVANQILGGGTASRLLADVRGERSLAYAAHAGAFELAHNEQPLLVYAGAEARKTPEAVGALLDGLARMVSAPPEASEVENARGSASRVPAPGTETLAVMADMVARQEEFGFPDGYWDAYRKQLRAVDPARVETAARNLYKLDKALVVVAGDADVVATELTKLGDVTVVDPEKEFKTMRTLPQVTR